MTVSISPVAAAPVARSVLVIGGLAAVTVAGLVLAVAIGPVTVPLDDTVAVLFGGTPDDPRSSVLIGTVRVPRALTAAVAGAALGADPQRAQQFIAWGLGSFAGTTWPDLMVLTPVAGLGLLMALASVKSLNALLLGENYARSMGLTVRWARLTILLSSSVLAGVITAFCGPVAFVGMAVPHLARLLVGTSDHRVLLPATLLAGVSVALACAVASHLPSTGGTIPLNVITSLIGAPVVITVLLRSRRLTAGAVL